MERVVSTLESALDKTDKLITDMSAAFNPVTSSVMVKLGLKEETHSQTQHDKD